MLENVKIKGVHATSFIMSWVREGGNLTWDNYEDFSNWLESLELSKEEIDIILEIARAGKLELEMSVMEFIKNKDKYSELRRSCREEA
jgi:hypothetical protein